MGLWTQSTFIQNVDNTVPHRETVCHGSPENVRRAPQGDVEERQTAAPGQGPGAETSASSVTFVSKRRNPRRR
ncbi:hypothetical protein RKD30_005705 [Streptomyces pristinaespiralis]|jgi:hypothetical protein